MGWVDGASTTRWIAAAALSLGAMACSSDWDLLDPRVGGDDSAGGAASGGNASGGDTSTGGDVATGGSGAIGAGGNGTGGSSTGGQGGAGVGGSGGAGGLPPGTLTVVASVADCVDSVTPDPDACEALVGLGTMTADGSTGPNATPAYSFLRFDVDDTLAGRTVTSVTLRLTVTSQMGADSSQSGDIWEVETFTRQDLFGTVPAQVGAAPLSPSQGAVVQDQLVESTLPNGSVAANAPITLGVFQAVTDGVDYWNLNGAVPPELVIDYE